MMSRIFAYASIRKFISIFVVAALVCTLCSPPVHAAQKGHKRTLRKGRRRSWQEGDIRLYGGRSRAMGTVLMYHNRKWGAVCDDLWDMTDADVVCRQIGFPGAARPALKMEFGGRGKGRMWISRVQCTGNETRLLDCDFIGWGYKIRKLCPGEWRAAGAVCLPQTKKSFSTHRKQTANSSPKKKAWASRRKNNRTGKAKKDGAKADNAEQFIPKHMAMVENEETLKQRQNVAAEKTTSSPETVARSRQERVESENTAEFSKKKNRPTERTMTTEKPGHPIKPDLADVDTNTDLRSSRPSADSVMAAVQATNTATTKPSVSTSARNVLKEDITLPAESTGVTSTSTTMTTTPTTTMTTTTTSSTSTTTTTTTPTTMTTTTPTTVTTPTTTMPTPTTTTTPTTTSPTTTPTTTSTTTTTPITTTTPTTTTPTTTTSPATTTSTAPTTTKTQTTTTMPATIITTTRMSTKQSSATTTTTVTLSSSSTTAAANSTTQTTLSTTLPPKTTSATTMSSVINKETTTKKAAEKVVDLSKLKPVSGVKLDSKDKLEAHDALLLQADSPSNPPLEVRLVGGRYRTEGRMEVREMGREDAQWGGICGAKWGMRETMVVCREMGYNYAKQPLQTNYFGGQEMDKIYYAFNCTGRESSLSDCESVKISDELKCPKSTLVAGVVCSTYLPDLIPDTRALEDSVRLQDRPLYYLQCALEENCLSSSAYVVRNTSRAWRNNNRRLLRFSTVVHNRGVADFRPYVAKGQWQWHSCHMHYHSMEIFAHYDIVDANGTRLAEGSKASFCLEDTTCDRGVRKNFLCAGFGDQGLSVNCSDNYMWDIDCQWIDITDLPPGGYTFLIEVNPDMLVAELSFDNNVARCDLWYTGYFAKFSNCRLESLLDYRRYRGPPASVS